MAWRSHLLGLGTIINAAAIVAGGILGLLCGTVFSERLQETVRKTCGISTIFIGMSGALSCLLTVDNGAIISRWGLLVSLCLVLGAVFGELLDIEGKLQNFGLWIKSKSGAQGDSRFLDAFVTASLTVCIGAMAIVGAIDDGTRGDISVLVTKSVLDFVIILIMTSSMGRGCIFSAVPVLIFQGSVTLLATVLQPLLTQDALTCISAVGGILIFCVGLNLVFGSLIRVANLLPAIILASFAPFVPFLML